VAASQEVKPLPDRIGKAVVQERSDNYALYGVPEQQLQQYRSKLRQIGSWILAQPALSPPVGFNARGRVLIRKSELCPAAGPCLKAPVAAWAAVPLFAWMLNLSSGREYTQMEFREDINIHVNNPWTSIQNRYALDPGPLRKGEPLGYGVDDADVRFLVEPKHLTDIDGCPLYEDANGDRQFLVITKIRKPLFVNCTREAYLRTLLRWWSVQLKTSEEVLAREESGPAAAAYRDWIAGREQRAQARMGASSLLKNSPEKAEELLRNGEETEQKVTANLLREMEKERAARGDGAGKDAHLLKTEKDVAAMRNIFERLKQKAAAMSPAERSAQARHFRPRPWESIDSPEGEPLVVFNPDFLDPAVSRTAIQIITADFNYVRDIERGRRLRTTDGPAATNLGVSRMKRESRWSDLKALMPEPRL
jgi:hypothetical protein